MKRSLEKGSAIFPFMAAIPKLIVSFQFPLQFDHDGWGCGSNRSHFHPPHKQPRSLKLFLFRAVRVNQSFD